MSSILTNTSAMVALQTLRGINSNLAQTQSEISTGKSVANARDNAAVWAISRTMESDVKGFKAIESSLALGQSTVGVARQAAETVTDLLTQMKGHITSAQEGNVDRAKIQEDVSALRDQIRAVVGAAQFNGLNLVDGSQPSVNVLASLDRSGGTVSPTNITVQGQNLGSATAVITGAFGGDDTVADSVEATGTTDIQIDGAQFAAGSRIVVNIGQQQVSYTVRQADVADAGNVSNNIAAGLRDAILGSGIEIGNTGIGIELDDDTLTLTNNTANEITITARAEGAGAGGLAGLAAIDVSNDHTGALAEIDALINTAINAASAFGSAQGRIDTQSEFVKNLSDALTTGIGSLVDADMEATSARLQALQVQQQLATQSLSIANQQPQNILSLFR